LNSDLAEAHTSLALIAENYDYDWQTAEKEFRRAIDLDPQYATAHQWYGECLSYQGRFDEALVESERARQLDPISLIIATDHAVILYYACQYDRAIEQFLAVRAMDPDFPRAHMVASAYLEKGMFSEALDDAERWKPDNGSRPFSELTALIYARSGDLPKARQSFAKWKADSTRRHEMINMVVVEAMVAMGEKDEAIAALTRSYQEHSNLVTSIKVDPALDPLRSDKRFQELLRRIGLEG
jgi:tetratricopeptide (TPR) repeat protein